jgi:hypothetical protein
MRGPPAGERLRGVGVDLGSLRMKRWHVALLAATAVLSCVAIGWTAWVAFQPRYWFDDAYSA